MFFFSFAFSFCETCCVSIRVGITCFTDLVYFGLLTSPPIFIIAVWLFVISAAPGLSFRWIFFFNDLYSHLNNWSHVIASHRNKHKNSINFTEKNAKTNHSIRFWAMDNFWRSDNNFSKCRSTVWNSRILFPLIEHRNEWTIANTEWNYYNKILVQNFGRTFRQFIRFFMQFDLSNLTGKQRRLSSTGESKQENEEDETMSNGGLSVFPNF